MYTSKHYTCKEIDQRLLQGYYDDVVAMGYTGTLEDFLEMIISIANKVDKKTGYDLSQNDFTNELKEKLDSINVSDINKRIDITNLVLLNKTLAEFTGFVKNVSLGNPSEDESREPKIYFDVLRKTFVGRDSNGVFFSLNDAKEDIQASFLSNGEVNKSKIFKCRDKLYCWENNANTMIQISGSGGDIPIIHHTVSDTPFVLTPNALHVWPEVEQLHLTFAPAEEGYVGEYSFQFTCPEDKATNLMLPTGLEWPDKKEVLPKAGMIYRAVILNNFIIML